ncbi:DUF1684 domain-containing protein [Myceligenerans pegani]|uniref:DUF1684 domain-containing protein n=1 Tax=Myceligenerans pegani TaxID=2776917 RepID=A0ABR9N3H4_9MICO|nr:DUF1684 domain-containing protein [Myceligenerans sp. TRM 65318]MBE1878206.1 DUF1684 domain-containing protein [Myceligenerans sp. TRM 65318]MBE3020477.1 DUF1684 domain-containing protein [Myceligenerans sp. TRM 65318]
MTGSDPHTAPGRALAVADWRRRVFALYDDVRARAGADPAEAHAAWVAGRDELFATHPASPLLDADRTGFTGLRVAPYDPAWRFETRIVPAREPRRLEVPTGTDGVVPFELLGAVELPGAGSLDVWRLASYGGGLFVPVKDALAGRPGGTYGGGRYLVDTIKGAWLGEPGDDGDRLVLDLNFAYNPSCAYDPAWACPLAQAGNTLAVPVPVGELMPA